MAKFSRFLNDTKNIFDVFLQDNTQTDGRGKGGITNSSSGLSIGLKRELASSWTYYTSAGSSIGGISTIGAWVAPSANQCNFAYSDNVSAVGAYQLHILDAIMSVNPSGDGTTMDFSRYIEFLIQGTGFAPYPFEVELRSDGPYLGVVTGGGTLTGFADSLFAKVFPTGTPQGRAIIWRTGQNKGQQVQVAPITPGSGTFVTYQSMLYAPSVGDQYLLF